MANYTWVLEHIRTRKQEVLSRPLIKVGRSNHSHIKCVSRLVSRNHAEFLILSDGSLRIRHTQSVNGIYVNRRLISGSALIELHENDEVGIGISGARELLRHLPNNSRYYVYNVKKRVLRRRRHLADNPSGGGQNNEQLMSNIEEINSRLSSAGISGDLIVISPPPTPDRDEEMADNLPVETNLQEDDVNVNNEVNNLPSTSSAASSTVMSSSVPPCDTIIKTEVEIKEEPKEMLSSSQYNLHEDYIVIQDDDDDDNLCASQLFQNETDHNEIDDDKFLAIKKELEQLDKFDDTRSPQQVVVDSDSELDDFQIERLLNIDEEPVAEEKVAESEVPERVEQCSPQPSSSTAGLDEENHVKLRINSISTTNFYLKPPIIEPHVIEKKSPKTKSENTSPRIKNKRKQPEKDQRKDKVKKTKTTAANNYNTARTDMKGIQTEFIRRSHGSTEKKDTDKEERERLSNIRKQKLKEIANKSSNQELANKKKSVVKVKVSDGRGTFLTNANSTKVAPKAKESPPRKPLRKIKVNVQVAKPTAKAVNIPLPVPTMSSTVEAVQNKQVSHVIRPFRNHPNSTDLSTGSELMEIVEWNVIWLDQQKQCQEPPPINEVQPSRMLDYFASFKEYYDKVKPLIMSDMWSYIYKEFEDTFKRQNYKFCVSVEEETKYSRFARVELLTYVSRSNYFVRDHVKEGDLVILDVKIQLQGQLILKTCFGLVTATKRTILKETEMINERLGKELKFMPFAKMKFSVLIKLYQGHIPPSRISCCAVITSLTSFYRLFGAVRNLKSSPLLQLVLKPEVQDYQIPSVHMRKVVSEDILNPSQLQCVLEASHMCMQDKPGIYLMQGPPGTGKTTVIINIILELLYGPDAKRDTCILVVAPSNGTIDAIVMKLIKQIRPNLTDAQKKLFRLIRIGPRNNIHPDVTYCSLDELAKKNMKSELLKMDPHLNDKHEKLLKETEELKAMLATEQNNRAEIEKRLKDLHNRLNNFCRDHYNGNFHAKFEETTDFLVSRATIICTTLFGCVGKKLEDTVKRSNLKITCCIVDEATQSSEQETLIPLLLGINKIVLVGDPQQLPAIVMSKEAKDLGYGQSLFKRVEKNFVRTPKNPIRMLDVQYRMNAEICKFPNSEFYDGKLRTKVLPHDSLRKLLPYLVFNINCVNGQNYQNDPEVNFVMLMLKAILLHTGSSFNYNVGIITPYNDQRRAINLKLKEYNFPQNMDITCNTVDSFQGQEKDIIILSCVRSTPNNFLCDNQRMNVAITRAKHILYIVGTNRLFQNCGILGKISRDAEKRNLQRNVSTWLKSEDILSVISLRNGVRR